MKLGNFVGTYLNAKPQEEDYIKILEDFEHHYSIPGTDTILKMNFTIYGTMDSANIWFHKLNNSFTKIGHWYSWADLCVCIKWTLDNGYVLFSTYTNDILIGVTSVTDLNSIKQELSDMYKITDLETPNKILRISLIVNEGTGAITIHQQQLINKALVSFGMQDANQKYTPLPPNVKIAESQVKPTYKDVFFMQDKP